MDIALAVSIVAALVSVLAARYARSQATSAQRQAASAEDQVKEAREANRQAQEGNRLAAEQLALLKEEREEAQRVLFRFQPRRVNFMDYLDLVNDGPFDTYIEWAQLAGPTVDPALRGKQIRALEKLGGTHFVAARNGVQILDRDGAPGFAGSPVMASDSTAQLTLLLKTEGRFYEVRTDVRLDDDRGFSTRGTVVTPK